MSLTRRQALAAAAGTGLAITAGCRRASEFVIGEPRHNAPSRKNNPEHRFLARMGFGARPGDVDRLKSTGREAWLDAQLDAPFDDQGPLAYKIQRLEVTQLGAWDLRDWPEQVVLSQMQRATILRAVESPWQVRERMVDFWTNHFNIYARKGMGAYRKPVDERNVVRKHALGNFGDMLRASSKSSAMLVYLDQQASTKSHPNENYARELLELHTLGVNSGYTQEDVMEVARCLTGWTEERGFLKRKGDFSFDPGLHDDGAKTVLGQRIPAGGGVEDGERVVQILLDDPRTARFVSRKMCRHFLGEGGDTVAPEVERVFVKTNGDIKQMVRTIALSSAIDQGPPVLKRPFDFVVSCVRAVDAETGLAPDLSDRLQSMSQPLYEWPMPDGYPVDPEAWQGSLLARWNFCLSLCNGGCRGVGVDFGRLSRTNGGASIESVIYGGDIPPSVSEVTHGLETEEERAFACLTAPEFQWK